MRRRLVLVVAMVALMFGGGSALAQPPEGGDPTCDTPQRSGEACAGDNGSAGCEGVNRAQGRADEEAQDALDFVSDILGEGSQGGC